MTTSINSCLFNLLRGQSELRVEEHRGVEAEGGGGDRRRGRGGRGSGGGRLTEQLVEVLQPGRVEAGEEAGVAGEGCRVELPSSRSSSVGIALPVGLVSQFEGR